MRSTSTRSTTFIDISAFFFAVAFKATVAFADKVSWQITAFRVFNTTRCYSRVFTFVYISASKTVALITGKARTLKTADGVCTVCKNITGPVFAFIYIRVLAVAAAETVITMAHTV